MRTNPFSKANIINYANRGMALENDINITNEYYLEKDIAVIYKKPTPIKVTKVSYPSRSSTIIKEAFYEKPSTTDYNGIYKGKYIDFDAKEVKNAKAFSLSNIHKHQLVHLEKVMKHGGISFLIVRFYINNTTYLLLTKDILNFINNNDRVSIPIDYFETNAYKIKDGYIPRIDYLKVIDKLFMEDVWKRNLNVY